MSEAQQGPPIELPPRIPESMVDHVARAISEDRHECSSYWKTYRATARAAIAAMREPTRHMIEEGYPRQESTAYSVWQAMIDEALK